MTAIFVALRWVCGLLMGFSLTMFLPLIVVYSLHEHDAASFILSGTITFLAGFIGYFSLYRYRQPVNQFGGFVAVAIFWLVFSAFAALPFFFSTHHTVDFTNCIFETVSGFTTTGSSIFSDLDHLPKALLYYRQQLEFLGGLGMVTLALALMPHLNIGSAKKLFLPESPDPVKDNDVAIEPHKFFTNNIRFTWMIYAGMTLACAIAYWLAGLSPLEAIDMSFSTVSTGGFVPHDANFSYYPQVAVTVIAEIFMILGALNFNLHMNVLRSRSLRPYWQDTETRVYFVLIILVLAITLFILQRHHVYASAGQQLQNASLTVISLMTTAGFCITDYASWPSFLPYLLMIVALIGGPGNSSAGGLKILRFWVILKCIYYELCYLINPKVKKHMYVSGKHFNESVVRGVLIFFCVYAAWLACVVFWLIDLGLDLSSAFGAVVACLSTVGLGIGKYAYSFIGISHPAQWLLIITMIAGRLEIFTLLILFVPTLWLQSDSK